MAQDILDAVYGCLIAGAIGDALGAPAENLYYDQVRERYGRITDLQAYDNVRYSTGLAGAVTDDTTLRHYICLAIVRKGGRITPEDAAQMLQGASALRADWIEKVETANRPFFEKVEGDPDANFRSMAVRMVEALRGELRAAKERAAMLERIGMSVWGLGN
jgi:hypothetical protein